MTNKDEIKTTSGFEKFLFGLTRAFALVGSLFALVGIAILLLSLFSSSDKSSLVSLSDLRPSQKGKSGGDQVTRPSEIKIQIPANVKQYMSGDNEKILYGWIESLDRIDQKDFIENLSSIIDEAEKSNEDVFDIITIITEYTTVKLSKMHGTELEKYAEIARKVAVIGAIFGLVLFIALISVILVMLAIERNTRKIISS